MNSVSFDAPRPTPESSLSSLSLLSAIPKTEQSGGGTVYDFSKVPDLPFLTDTTQSEAFRHTLETVEPSPTSTMTDRWGKDKDEKMAFRKTVQTLLGSDDASAYNYLTVEIAYQSPGIQKDDILTLQALVLHLCPGEKYLRQVFPKEEGRESTQRIQKVVELVKYQLDSTFQMHSIGQNATPDMVAASSAEKNTDLREAYREGRESRDTEVLELEEKVRRLNGELEEIKRGNVRGQIAKEMQAQDDTGVEVPLMQRVEQWLTRIDEARANAMAKRTVDVSNARIEAGHTARADMIPVIEAILSGKVQLTDGQSVAEYLLENAITYPFDPPLSDTEGESLEKVYTSWKKVEGDLQAEQNGA